MVVESRDEMAETRTLQQYCATPIPEIMVFNHSGLHSCCSGEVGDCLLFAVCGDLTTLQEQPLRIFAGLDFADSIDN